MVHNKKLLLPSQIIMQKQQSGKVSSGLEEQQKQECQSPLLTRHQSLRSEPPPRLSHKISNESIISIQSKNSTQEYGDPTKTSKLQIIKDKVSMMIKSSPRITLDSIKMESIEDFAAYTNIIQKPQIVTHFSKNNSRLGDQILEILNLNLMKQLAYLSLQNANLSQNGFIKILKTDLPKLRSLYLAHNNIGDCELKDIESNKLNLLSLTNNKITFQGIIKIRRIFDNLQSLTLKLNNIKTEGLKQLLKGNMLRLKHLHLESCGLTSQSMGLFQTQGIEKQIPNLVSLYLNFNPIKSQGLQKLLQSLLIPNLQVLHLEGSLVGQSLSIFKQHYKSLSKITLLNLCSNNLTDELVKEFASISLPRVNLINFDNNNLTVQSLFLMSKSEFPWLLHLMVNYNPQIMSKIDNYKSLAYSFFSVTKKHHNKVLFKL